MSDSKYTSPLKKYAEYHYMIDLETLGVTPDSVITSIAVVEFDLKSGQIIREFYKNIDIQSSLDLGFSINGDTLEWWFSQPNRMEMLKNKQPVKKVLEDLVDFLYPYLTTGQNISSGTQIGYNQTQRDNVKKKTIVWGNGSSFDLGILGSAFIRCGMAIPWMFFNERDVRTMVSLMPEVKKDMVNNGTPHNPIDDCRFQIAYLCEIYKRLKG